MNETLITIPVIAIVVGIIIQTLKGFKIEMDKDLIPSISILVGGLGNIIMAISTGGLEINYIQSFIAGAIAGGLASGGYDGLAGLYNKAKKKTE